MSFVTLKVLEFKYEPNKQYTLAISIYEAKKAFDSCFVGCVRGTLEMIIKEIRDLNVMVFGFKGKLNKRERYLL